MTSTESQAWFRTRYNPTLHHAVSGATGTAECSGNIAPRPDTVLTRADELPEDALQCLRCKAKIAQAATGVVCDTAAGQTAQPDQDKPKRLTATQTWNRLTLLQRDQIMAWFVTTYAPSRNVARFTLTKNPTLTHAESIIAEHWQGMEP